MQKLILKYYNPVLKIALGNWNQVFYIPEEGAAQLPCLLNIIRDAWYSGYLKAAKGSRTKQ